MLTHFVDGDNARVLQGRHSPGFSAKALPFGPAGKLAAEDHFHGDDSVEAELLRFVNNPHSAAGDFFEQFVISEAVEVGRLASGLSRLTDQPSFQHASRAKGLSRIGNE